MITLVATCQVGLVHYTSRCGCCVGGLMYEAGVEKRACLLTCLLYGFSKV